MKQIGKLKNSIKVKIAKTLVVLELLMFSLMHQVLVYAAKNDGASQATQGINNGLGVLKAIILAGTNGVGFIFVVISIIDFASAYSAHETTQQTAAIKKFVGAVMIIAVPDIAAALTS